MPDRLGVVRGSLLALLPTAAFFVGPTLAQFLPDDSADVFVYIFVYSFLPTVLPLAALAIVGVVAYHRTRSIGVTASVTALALVLAVIGAVAFLLAVWPAD
jgi:hypothetical protein